MCVITTPTLTPITCTCCPPSVLLSFRHCRSARVSALFGTSRSGAGTEDSRPTTVPTTSTETATHGTTSTQTDTAPTTTTADPRLAGSGDMGATDDGCTDGPHHANTAYRAVFAMLGIDLQFIEGQLDGVNHLPAHLRATHAARSCWARVCGRAYQRHLQPAHRPQSTSSRHH